MVYKIKTPTEQQIDAIKYTIAQIEKHGDSALNNIDKGKGRDWALKELNSQLKYFENKLKKERI